MFKKCCHCKKDLPIDCFQKNQSAPDGLQHRCKACTKKASKECRDRRGHLWLPAAERWKNRPENRDRRNATTRARQAQRKLENPEKVREERRRWSLKTKYGLTPELKAALVLAQDSLCSICLTSINAVNCATDHDHAGDFVRGMLCKTCNSALGLFKDDPDILRRAAEYIEESRSIPTEPSTEDFIIATEILEKYLGRKSEEPISIPQSSSIEEGEFASGAPCSVR